MSHIVQAEATPMPHNRTELIVILGALTAFAPLSIDMYLPALPAIAQAFGAGPDRVQLTLATFFLGFALGQAFYGPITDRFGRKPPLYVSLTLFVAASAGCAIAPSIDALSGLRFLQAIGACAGAVIARAMVRDLFTPAETPRIYAALMLVMGVAPMLAPLLGGYVLVGFGWTAIFWILAALGVGCLLAVLRLPETQPADSVRPLAFGRIIADYASLLGHRAFLGYTLAGAVSLAGMFAYIAGSPFVFIELYHVPAEHYGWLFGINAFGIIAASQISAQLVKRWGPGAILHGGCLVQAIAGTAILGAAATGLGGLASIAVPLFVYVSTVGFVMPNATALAMAPHGRAAGIASALLGTLQFAIAAIAATLVGLLNNGTALPMACVIAGCGLLGFVLYRILVGHPSQPIGAAP